MGEAVVVDSVIARMSRGDSHSAFVALGKAADPQMHVEFLPTARRFGPTPTSLAFCRPKESHQS